MWPHTKIVAAIILGWWGSKGARISRIVSLTFLTRSQSGRFYVLFYNVLITNYTVSLWKTRWRGKIFSIQSRCKDTQLTGTNLWLEYDQKLIVEVGTKVHIPLATTRVGLFYCPSIFANIAWHNVTSAQLEGLLMSLFGWFIVHYCLPVLTEFGFSFIICLVGEGLTKLRESFPMPSKKIEVICPWWGALAINILHKQ